VAKPGSHPPTHTHTHSYQGFCMADVAKTSISNSNSHKFKRLSLSFEGKQKGLAKKSMRLKRTASCSAFHTAVAFSIFTHTKKILTLTEFQIWEKIYQFPFILTYLKKFLYWIR